MSIRTHLLLSSLAAKAGAFAGMALAMAVVMNIRGFDWWAEQPLWLNMAPLVGGPVIGLLAGIGIMRWIGAACPFCGGRCRNTRRGPKRQLGYWCDSCARNGLDD